MSQPTDDPELTEEEYIARLVEGAMRHKNQYARVKHILSDESLNAEQRSEALEVLKLRLDQKQRGIE
jgi:hypothetical protein